MQAAQPLVSTIVPCYNQAGFLPETLASIQAQTCTDWEVLIVNDGSPDNTRAVAAEWVKKDPRFRYIEKPNGGLSSARNAGLAQARGKFIQLLDSDDVILPEKFAIQIAALARQASPAQALCYCDYRKSKMADVYSVYREDENYMRLPPADARFLQRLAADWETRVSIPAHCYLFTADFFGHLNIRFDESLPNHEDWECWMRIARQARTVVYCPEVLAYYRTHANSMSRNLRAMRTGYLQAIDKQLGEFRDDPKMSGILTVKRAEMDDLYKRLLRDQSRAVRLWRYLRRGLGSRLRRIRASVGHPANG